MVLTRSQAEQAESRRGLFISRLESAAEPTPRRQGEVLSQPLQVCHKPIAAQPTTLALRVGRRRQVGGAGGGLAAPPPPVRLACGAPPGQEQALNLPPLLPPDTQIAPHRCSNGSKSGE